MSKALSIAGSDRLMLVETFVRIVESGSLSAAANQLGTTQPTVSRRLQTLEKMLGVRLLQRSTHAMTLTRDGMHCYEHAKQLLDGWHVLERETQGDNEQPVGTLKVVAPHALGQIQLMDALAAFLAMYPKVNVEWYLTDRMPDFIVEDIDCAIHIGEVRDPSLVALKLAEVPRIVAAAPELIGQQPIVHPRDLVCMPWIALRTFYRSQLEFSHAQTGAKERVEIRPRLSTDGLYAVRSAAIQGVGVCLASSWALADDVATGRLVQLLPQWLASPLPVSLVYRQARLQPPRLRLFINAMRRALPNTVAGL